MRPCPVHALATRCAVSVPSVSASTVRPFSLSILHRARLLRPLWPVCCCVQRKKRTACIHTPPRYLLACVGQAAAFSIGIKHNPAAHGGRLPGEPVRPLGQRHLLQAVARLFLPRWQGCAYSPGALLRLRVVSRHFHRRHAGCCVVPRPCYRDGLPVVSLPCGERCINIVHHTIQ